MRSVSGFQQQALTLAGSLPPSELFQALRSCGYDSFASAEWPGRKTEQWKYTSLLALQDFSSAVWAKADQQAAVDALASLSHDDATRLVFVDGIFNADLSDALPEGVTLFNSANAASAGLIASYLGKIATVTDQRRRNIFVDLNNAWLADGVLVHVPANVRLERPVSLIYLGTDKASHVVSSQRLLVVLERGASASLIEHYLSASGSAAAMMNALTEIHIGENARLHHTRLNLEHEDSVHIGSVHANLQRSAVLDGFTLAEGGRLKRLDYQINHCGEGAELNLNGIYLARNSQLVDYHTCIEHRVPHCTSQEVFRGIVGDRARAVFNGRIHILPDAQKTLAELSNRNLLTSNFAEIDTKPELEIYADDVRCAHGATISQLDETALYYLKSRGIDAAQARMMLSYGFINEVLETLPYPQMLGMLQQYLRQRFVEETLSA
jgi:Fe-S cluster assembly protein SufD